jgi:hypothetical protein
MNDPTRPGATLPGTPATGGAGPGERRLLLLKVVGVCGAVVGYGCLAAFLYLISLQIYRWFRQGEWTHFGVSEGMRVGLTRCCVSDTDSGRLAALVHWLDAPADWMGLHKLLEVLPASLALFLLSMLGNSIFIYCRDRIDDAKDT